MKKILNGMLIGGLTFLPFGALYLAVVKPITLLILGGVLALVVGYLTYRDLITYDTIILTGKEKGDE